MANNVQLGVFDSEGFLVAVEPSVKAAVAVAKRDLGVPEVIYEIDPTVVDGLAPRVDNGPRSPAMAMERTQLPVLSEDEVMRMTPAEAHAVLKRFAPELRIVQQPPGQFAGRWLLGTNAKMKKTDVRRGELPAWVLGLALLPHEKPFQLPLDALSASMQRPFLARIEQRVHTRQAPTVCYGASPECRQVCLVYSGKNETNDAPRMAKRHKTNMLLLEPAAFVRMLVAAIETHIRRCEREGYEPFFRLNVYSDIPWELFTPWLFRRFPKVTFYDYTKVPSRVTPKNYHLSFSYSGRNILPCRSEAERGINPVFVFAIRKKDPKPQRLNVHGLVLPVIDGDLSDVRPRDKKLAKESGFDPRKPAVVGLFYKAPKRANRNLNLDVSRSAFVVPVQVFEDGAVILPSVPRFENEAGADIDSENTG